MYLSQLTLNPHNRQVQSELVNPYQLHRTLLRAFDAARQEAGVLHRLEGERAIAGLGRAIVLLVQSQAAPAWAALTDGRRDYLLAPPLVKPVTLTPPAGTLLRFRLRANPSWKEKRADKRNSARRPLRDDAERLAWLARKGEQHGFHLLHANIVGDDYQQDWTARKDDGRQRLTVEAVLFEGVLQVTDAAAFAHALAHGVGPARAFGCGLLSPAPA